MSAAERGDEAAAAKAAQALRCANHPDRETYVRCSDCGKPICPDCMVYSAVGIKCAECARLPRSARLTFGRDRWIRGIAGAVIGGAAIGYIYYFLLSMVGYFYLAFIVGGVIGYVMGLIVLRATRYYRGREASIVAVLGTIWAFVFPPVFSAVTQVGLSLDTVAFVATRAALVNWLVMAVAGYVAWQRTR